jgi:membrane protein involved in colicin uptake
MPPTLNLKDWADEDLLEAPEDGRVLAQAKLDERMRRREEKLAREAEEKRLAEENAKKKAEEAAKKKAAADAKRRAAAEALKAQVSVMSRPKTRIHENTLIV